MSISNINYVRKCQFNIYDTHSDPPHRWDLSFSLRQLPRLRPRTMDLHRLLSDDRLYLTQIEKLHCKHLQSHKLYTLCQNGVTLASLSHNRRKLARILARSVSRGRYRFHPAQVREITVKDKQRKIYLFCLTDLIVQGALATVLTQAMRPLLSESVYSFREGTSWHKAVAKMAHYLREHRASRPDPKTRGVYVLRRDVRQYAESVPVDDDSPLWPLLRHILVSDPRRARRSARHWELLKQAIRPECRCPEGRPIRSEGIPTGAPIAPPLLNLYLTQLDEALDGAAGAFYARYGDDFLFAHPDPAVVHGVEDQIDAILSELRLKAHRNKTCSLYLNGAGRPSVDWPQTRGASAVSFLGCNVSFDGVVSLTQPKTRELLRDLGHRALRTQRAARDAGREATGRAVCAALNQSLDPRNPLGHKSALPLRSVVTDRGQLKQLDYQIARLVLRSVTGSTSVRAFRQVPYRKLRGPWRLISLYHARNGGKNREKVPRCMV